MAKKILSIAIGTECTKVCEVSYEKNYKNKGMRVYKSISFPTPPNSIDDGYIKDKAAFADELKIQLKAARIKSDKVIFSLTSGKIANREVTIPPTKEKRIMDIIKTGASEYFPIDMREYILSYTILEKDTSKRQDKALRKRQDEKEKKLAKKQAKLDKKALKKKSKTEIIADNLELLEAQGKETADIGINPDNSSEDKGADSNKRQMRISVFAAPSSIVKNYYSFAKLMHFDIVSLDYSGNSSYQAIKRQAARGTNVFVQINEQDTLISILRDDVLILQRTVGYGLSAITDAVMEQPYYKAGNAEEAFTLLKDKNLLSLEPETKELPHLDSSWSRGEAAAASEYILAIGSAKKKVDETELEAKRNVRDSLHQLAGSVARILDYYKSSHKQIDIDTIYITGSGVLIQGIDSFFAAEIGIAHKKMEKLYTFSSAKKATAYRINPSEFLTCVGAAIKPVDFVPLEFTLKKQKRSVIIGTIIFSLACIAGSAGTIYVSYTDYLAAKQELSDAQKQLDNLPQLSGAHEEYSNAVKELDDLKKLEDMTQSNNDNINDVINELEKKLPKGTITNSMQFNETGVTMNITVSDSNTNSNAIIAKTLKQLKDIEYFKGKISYSDISVNEDSGISTVNLTITCNYSE